MLLGSFSAWATYYHGQVFYQGIPIPGATVIVSQGAKRFTTVTDEQGLYEFPDLADGTWKIEIQMRGFETLKGDVTVAPNQPQGSWELQIVDLQQMLASTKVAQPETQPQLAQRAEEKPTRATPKPSDSQVHPTARSKLPCKPNVNETLLGLHPKSTAVHHFEKGAVSTASMPNLFPAGCF